MATRNATKAFGYNSLLPNLEQKQRVFVIKENKSPIRLMIAVKHTSRKPLTFFDGKLNRALRYATNQLTPFMDEQDGVVTMEPIVFDNGTLIVPEWNVNLQKFLLIHPQFNKTFFELDKEANASKEVESIYSELDAQIEAKNLNIDDLEAIARVLLFGGFMEGKFSPDIAFIITEPLMKMILSRLEISLYHFLNRYSLTYRSLSL